MVQPPSLAMIPGVNELARKGAVGTNEEAGTSVAAGTRGPTDQTTGAEDLIIPRFPALEVGTREPQRTIQKPFFDG